MASVLTSLSGSPTGTGGQYIISSLQNLEKDKFCSESTGDPITGRVVKEISSYDSVISFGVNSGTGKHLLVEITVVLTTGLGEKIMLTMYDDTCGTPSITDRKAIYTPQCQSSIMNNISVSTDSAQIALRLLPVLSYSCCPGGSAIYGVAKVEWMWV